MRTRCINIDWLECYCIEDAIGFPHNADYFRELGFLVRERDYGTPMYNEMFTVFGHDDLPFIEIRRFPKSSWERQENGLFDPRSAHVRFVNRSCYFNEAARIMQQFLEEHHFAFQRISRIDLCLDFEKFDTGDMPQTFLQRFFVGKYAKINQVNIAARARDQWNARAWNSVSWGSKTSMVTTRFYNKTLELKEVKDKPYIRQQWLAAGLVDDVQDLWKIGDNSEKYQPDIWRLEFAITSGTKKWFRIEREGEGKNKIQSIHHTLGDYFTKQQLLDRFFSLVDHYFHFKHVEYLERRGVATAALDSVTLNRPEDARKLQRKDRCSDKVLFYPKEQAVFYRIDNTATTEPRDKYVNRLLEQIKAYQEHVIDPKVYKACNVLIAKLEEERRFADLSRPWSDTELTAIRLLIAQQMNNKGVNVQSLSELTQAIEAEKDLFGESEVRGRKAQQ